MRGANRWYAMRDAYSLSWVCGIEPRQPQALAPKLITGIRLWSFTPFGLGPREFAQHQPCNLFAISAILRPW